VHDVAARRPLLGAVLRHRLGVFRCQHDVLAPVAEDSAQHGLRAAHVGIDVGGIEQRDAEVERLVDHLARGLEVDALAEIVAADADRGDAQAGAAEIANLHEDSPVSRKEAERRVLWRALTPAARRVRTTLPHAARLAEGGGSKRLKKMRPRSDAATDGDRWGA